MTTESELITPYLAGNYQQLSSPNRELSNIIINNIIMNVNKIT